MVKFCSRYGYELIEKLDCLEGQLVLSGDDKLVPYLHYQTAPPGQNEFKYFVVSSDFSYQPLFPNSNTKIFYQHDLKKLLKSEQTMSIQRFPLDRLRAGCTSLISCYLHGFNNRDCQNWRNCISNAPKYINHKERVRSGMFGDLSREPDAY